MAGVEGVVELDEELVIAEGLESSTAATTGVAATEGAADGATEGATDGATDGTADAGPPEAAIEGETKAALSDPEDPGLDDPDPDDPDTDEDDPAADALEFDPDDAAPPPAGTLHLDPVGGVSVPLPAFSTEVPGSGNCTS